MNWTSAAPPAGIELNSWAFLLLGAAAVVVFRTALRPPLRHWLLLPFNVWFFLQFVGDPQVLLVVGGLLAVTWLLAKWRARDPDRLPRLVYLAIAVGFWAFLFLMKAQPGAKSEGANLLDYHP